MVTRGAEEGLYNTKDVDARGLASLLAAILLGMRLGKVLWKDEYDLNGAIAAMFLVHSGRLVMEMPGLNGILAPTPPVEERAVRAS